MIIVERIIGFIKYDEIETLPLYPAHVVVLVTAKLQSSDKVQKRHLLQGVVFAVGVVAFLVFALLGAWLTLPLSIVCIPLRQVLIICTDASPLLKEVSDKGFLGRVKVKKIALNSLEQIQWVFGGLRYMLPIDSKNAYLLSERRKFLVEH